MKIGILGGGQLGRMLALAGYRLGLQFRFFDTTPDVCAEQVGELQVGDFGDDAALRRFADGLDALTFEWENVPVDAAKTLAARCPSQPPVEALRVSQDRLDEKTAFRRLGIETARFAVIDSLDGVCPPCARRGCRPSSRRAAAATTARARPSCAAPMSCAPRSPSCCRRR